MQIGPDDIGVDVPTAIDLNWLVLRLCDLLSTETSQTYQRRGEHNRRPPLQTHARHSNHDASGNLAAWAKT
jgi:hypothetical protein